MVAVVGLLGGAELLVRVGAGLAGLDLQVDPLPVHEDYTVVCPEGEGLKLCPDQGPDYEKVRPERFSAVPERPRVAVVGESFVYGTGLTAEEAWPARLEAHLRNAHGTDVEVLNLGRCGTYASRLVATVHAATAEVNADVVVLAIGNNEHTMTSFYTGRAAHHPRLMYDLGRTLGQVRLYGLLVHLLGAHRPPVESPLRADDPVRQFDNALDQAVYAARRRPPDLSVFPQRLAGPEVTRLLEREQRLKEAIFEDRLTAMVRGLQDADVQVVLATLPRSLVAPPTLSGTRTEQADVLRSLIAAPVLSEDQLTTGLSIDPTVAHLLHARGQQLLRSGDPSGAAAAFQLAAEHDLVPDSTPGLAAITRRVAANRGTPLVDLDRLAEQWLSSPAPRFLDKVHVNARGADEVGAAVAEVVAPSLARTALD